MDSVDLYGEEYVRGFERNQSPERLERLLEHIELRPDFAVADFACGSGLLLEHIAPRVREYLGVDFSEPFIQAANRRKARLRISNAEFVCGDIVDFCRERREYFDTALAMDVSEHVLDREWLRILKGILSALKPGGRLYLHTPNAEFFLEMMKSKNFMVKQFKEHVAVRTPERNAELLRIAGFSQVETLLLPHYNSLKRIHPLSHLPLIGKYFKARILLVAAKQAAGEQQDCSCRRAGASG